MTPFLHTDLDMEDHSESGQSSTGTVSLGHLFDSHSSHSHSPLLQVQNDVTIDLSSDASPQVQVPQTQVPQTQVQVPQPRPLIRDDLVSTAVSFLLNPQIKNNPVEKKRSFLMKKGLTMDEVDAAFDWAEKGIPYRPDHVVTIYQPQGIQPQGMYQIQPQGRYQDSPFPVQSPGIWMLTRALVPSLAILTSVAAAVFFFYKHYIEGFFFPAQGTKRKHPLVVVTESVDKLAQSVHSLEQSVGAFESRMKRSLEESVGRLITEMTVRRPGSHAASSDELAVVKKEIQSLKGLLLSHNQFPESPIVSFIQQTSAALNGTSSLTGTSSALNGTASLAQSPPPSIPSWQLTDESKEEELKERQ